MTKWNFMLSWVKHEKSFTTLGPDIPCYLAPIIMSFSTWNTQKLYYKNIHYNAILDIMPEDLFMEEYLVIILEIEI